MTGVIHRIPVRDDDEFVIGGHTLCLHKEGTARLA